MTMACTRHAVEKLRVCKHCTSQRCFIWCCGLLAFQALCQHCRGGIVRHHLCCIQMEHLQDAMNLMLRPKVQDGLNDIIAQRMCAEILCIQEDCFHEPFHLLWMADFQQTLRNPATELVPASLKCNMRTSAQELVDYKLNGLGPALLRNHCDKLLEDIVGMRASCCLPYMSFHLTCQAQQRLPVTPAGRFIEGSLNNSASCRVPRECPHFTADGTLLEAATWGLAFLRIPWRMHRCQQRRHGSITRRNSTEALHASVLEAPILNHLSWNWRFTWRHRHSHCLRHHGCWHARHISRERISWLLPSPRAKLLHAPLRQPVCPTRQGIAVRSPQVAQPVKDRHGWKGWAHVTLMVSAILLVIKVR
mmetsp:Transcript_5464/g.10412  ORF Transcript_5464/g.10412 Transcript_5464/m.10412 type:complete len:362 (-) Transcript_5464:98-1183(-)